MKRRIVAILLIFIVCFSAGCGNKYNAELYTTAEEWLGDEFIKNNKVKAFYKLESPLETDGDITFDYVYCGTQPDSRTFIFNDESAFRQVFIKYDAEIDFNVKTVMLYVFANVYPRQFKIKKIDVNGEVADVEIYIQKRRNNDGTAPTPAYLMIVSDKLNVANANISIV